MVPTNTGKRCDNGKEKGYFFQLLDKRTAKRVEKYV